MKEESVPFIGDIFLMDRGVFDGSVCRDLSVSNLNIQDNIFKVEMNLKSAINKEKLDQLGVHVVIGIDLEITTEGNINLPGSIMANMLNGRPEIINLPISASVHHGKVKIMKYRVIPFQLINLVKKDISFRMNTGLDPSIFENIDVYQDYKRCWLQLSELNLNRMIPHSDRKILKTLQQTFSKFQENFSIDCFNLLQGLNTKNWYINIYSLMNIIRKYKTEVEAAVQELTRCQFTIRGKEAFVESLRKRGVTYVENATRFDTLTKKESVLILFFCKEYVESNNYVFRETLDFLSELIEKSRESRKDEEFLAVDLDVIPRNELRIPLPKKVAIYHFVKGQIRSLDFQGDFGKRILFNTAKCLKRGDENEPKRRGKFIAPCPNSFRGDCDREYHEWLCADCKTYLDYGFNDHVYCNCAEGKGTHLDNFEFMCTDFKHGFDYVKYNRVCNNYLDQIKPMKTISIVLLGQSGVGKSTWINGIVNYIQYEDFNVAKKSKIITAIPTQFTVPDQYSKAKVIPAGKDPGEHATIGASETQNCKTYTIRYKDYNVQLIDTPGLGDTRGAEQDLKNVKKILDYLRHYEELHGICIFLKPNESRIGLLMKYVIKEFLANLHKNCSKNIVYCFTNARISFYKPGDTLPVLEKLLDDMDVFMPLNKNTIYCFDNEAYQYLYTLNAKGFKYTQKEVREFELSWNKSVEETKRFLDYVSRLNPHLTQETTTLNQARRMILSLTRPIADLTHNIEMNIQIVTDHKKLIDRLDENDKDLLKKLYVPQLTLENTPLGHPRTVCTAESCVVYHVLPDAGFQLKEFIQHCHPHCHLKGVTPEMYPNPDLKHCAAMKKSGGLTCQSCKCPWKTHMHFLYEQKRTEIRVKNRSVEANIKSKNDLRTQKKRTIDDLEQQVNDLKGEKKIIIRIAGKFAHFLKQHAITPYNDCFCDYLDYLIDREEGKRFRTEKEKSILENLRNTKAAYEEEIEFLENALRSCPDSGEYDPNDVKEWEKELYQLPIHGNQLKQNMKVVIEAEDNAARYNQNNSAANENIPSTSGFIGNMVDSVRNWVPFKNKNNY